MGRVLEPTSSVESPAPVCSLASTSSRPCTSPGGPPRPKKASTTLVDHPPKHLACPVANEAEGTCLNIHHHVYKSVEPSASITSNRGIRRHNSSAFTSAFP